MAHSGTRALATAGSVIALALLPSTAMANDPPQCPDNPVHEVAFEDVLQLTPQCTDDGPGPLTYSLVYGPSGGVLSASDTSGNATYDPNFAGRDYFIYRATDSGGLFDEAFVRINVAPRVDGAGGQFPQCPDAVQAFVPRGGKVHLVGNCFDPEAASLFYGLFFGAPAPLGPAHGSFEITSPTSVNYVHGGGAGASDTFMYSVHDGWNRLLNPVELTITDPSSTEYSTGAEATEAEPYVAAVDLAEPKAVSIGVRPTSTDPPEGYTFLGQEYNIKVLNPDGTEVTQDPGTPIRLTFDIDRSEVTSTPVEILRDGVPVIGTCAVGIADPDPCLESRGFIDPADPTSDYRIVVLTTHASVWNAAFGPYDFGGFFSPVDNPDALNVAKAGSAIPVKFSLGGDQGLDVLDGIPTSRWIDCPGGSGADNVETTANSRSGLTYDSASDRYTYVWKTDGDWAGTCRQLTVRLADGTPHTALFQLK